MWMIVVVTMILNNLLFKNYYCKTYWDPISETTINHESCYPHEHIPNLQKVQFDYINHVGHEYKF
jgi:hypothetical protein